MKRLILHISIIIFISISSYSQTYKYAWLTDVHIGAPNAKIDLQNVVDDINERDNLSFAVVTGDIAEKGRNDELDTAKIILDELKIPYLIIPGNHDTKWSESGLTKFVELWKDDKFSYEINHQKHIGLRSGIPWRGGGGHIDPQDLKWLENELKKTPKNEEIYFYVHHPLDGDVDNWFKVTNLLRNYNIKGIFVGHGHANKLLNFNGIPAAMGRSTLSRPKYAGYNIVENQSDSILLSEIQVDSTGAISEQVWGGWSKIFDKNITLIDSLQFKQYSDSINILWKTDLNTSMSTSVLTDGDKIFASTIDGTIFCYNLNGKLLWKYETNETIFSKPVRDKDVLAVATIEGDLFTLNANNGELIQVIGLGEPLTSQLIKIGMQYNGIKTTAVVIGTSNGNLFCYDLYSLEQIWENHSAGLMIETKPLFISGKIIYGSWDNYLYCVDAANGNLIWKWTENKNFYYSPASCWPVTDGKNVYISTPDKYVSAIDLLQGTTVWRKKDFSSWESIGISNDKNNLLIKSIEDKFYIVSAKNGKSIKEIDLNFGLDTMPCEPIEWNDKIIFGGKDGMVYLINKDYSWEPLFFTGTARVHSIQHIKNNMFAASNMDGKIFIFTLKHE